MKKKFKHFNEINNAFEGVNIDEMTKAAINNYFLYDRISDWDEEKWKWLFRRRLNLVLPLYEQQLSMWKEYRTENWFYDKVKINKKQHTETTNLTENEKQALLKTLNETLDKILNETQKNTANLTSKDTTNQVDKTTSEADGTFDEDTKNRNFAFNYPESNYTGGVLPYNLDSNPSVEFLNTQGDALSKDAQTSHSETTTDYSSDTTKNTTQDQTEDQKKDTTGKDTRALTDNNQNTIDRTQDIKNSYTDDYSYDGSNIIELAHKLVELLPQADFFRELIAKLYDLFDHVWYTVGWCDAEDEEDY